MVHGPWNPGRPLYVGEYRVKVLSKKTKNLKTMNDLKNFGKQLIQFLLLPQFAIVFIFIIVLVVVRSSVINPTVIISYNGHIIIELKYFIEYRDGGIRPILYSPYVGYIKAQL